MKKLYVGNLPYQVTEGDLQNWFSQSGIATESVNIMRDRFSGEPRGFGFVEIADGDLDRAISSLNGKDLQGRTLVVNEARPPREHGAGGGGPRSGGGGGRGREGGGGRPRRSW